MAQEPEGKKSDSVFDFLYVDHRRIGLYLSQFSEYGNLKNLVHSQKTGSERAIAASTPGATEGTIAEGSQSALEHEGVERHYDTQWSQALNFLDELQAREMLARDISNTPIGGLLLTSGTLYLVSMRPFERTFGAISQGSDSSGNRRQRRAARSRGMSDAEEESSGLRILASLEQPVFAILRTENARLWSTLEPDYLVGGSADLNLKHGLHVSGDWHVLGILDCQPGPGVVSESEIGRLCGGGDNVFSDSIIEMWNEFRLVFGRPDDCFGITPLVIMREIV